MVPVADRVQAPSAELRARAEVEIQQCFKHAQVVLNLFGARARRCGKIGWTTSFDAL